MHAFLVFINIILILLFFYWWDSKKKLEVHLKQKSSQRYVYKFQNFFVYILFIIQLKWGEEKEK